MSMLCILAKCAQRRLHIWILGRQYLPHPAAPPFAGCCKNNSHALRLMRFVLANGSGEGEGSGLLGRIPGASFLRRGVDWNLVVGVCCLMGILVSAERHTGRVPAACWTHSRFACWATSLIFKSRGSVMPQ